MSLDELWNIDDILKHYSKINRKIFKAVESLNVSEIKKLMPKSSNCTCSMGHDDIRVIKACEQCKKMYTISSFKEKCKNLVFEVEWGKFKGKELVIKNFSNTIMVTKEINNGIKRSGEKLISNSDYFSNSFINSLIINKKYSDLVDKIYVGFICKNRGFQLMENNTTSGLQNINIERYDLVEIVRTLIDNLRKLTSLKFMHGNPIIDNISILEDSDGTYSVLLSNLCYSSVSYNGGRFFKSGIINSNEISLVKNKKFFTIGEKYVNLVDAIKFSGTPIYPCIIDLYCFIISMMYNKTLHDVLIDNKVFIEEIFKKMFYESDYESILMNINHDTDVNFVDCLRILKDTRLKTNVFSKI